MLTGIGVIGVWVALVFLVEITLDMFRRPTRTKVWDWFILAPVVIGVVGLLIWFIVRLNGEGT